MNSGIAAFLGWICYSIFAGRTFAFGSSWWAPWTILFCVIAIMGGHLASTMLLRGRLRRALREELNQRGVPLCISCGYDLAGMASPRCPECGAVATFRSYARDEVARRALVRLSLMDRWRLWLVPELARIDDVQERRRLFRYQPGRSYPPYPKRVWLMIVLLAPLGAVPAWAHQSLPSWASAAIILPCALMPALATSLIMRGYIREVVRGDLAARGIPICVKCGYDLFGLEASQCPECGCRALHQVLPGILGRDAQGPEDSTESRALRNDQ